MGSCIIEKFSYYGDLTDDEKAILDKFEDSKEHYKAGETVFTKGEKIENLYIVFDGWGYISANLDTSLRSIFDVRLDADFIGIPEISFQNHLYDLHALTDLTLCPFPRKHLDDIFSKSTRLRDIFFLIISREKAIANERIISIGRRTAFEKVAHFIVEISLRYGMLGMEGHNSFNFPLKQEHIADLLGLSPVHVSRAMTNLKNNGYIQYNRSTMHIVDQDKLRNLAAFDPSFVLKPDISFDYSNDNVDKNQQHA